MPILSAFVVTRRLAEINEAKTSSEETVICDAELISDRNMLNEVLSTRLVALLRKEIFGRIDNCRNVVISAALNGSGCPAFLRTCRSRFSDAASERNFGEARNFALLCAVGGLMAGSATLTFVSASA